MDTSVQFKVIEELPTRHQFGRFIFASIVGFVASKSAESAYEKILMALKNRAANKL